METDDQQDELTFDQYGDIYHEDDVPFQDISRGVARKLLYLGGALFVTVVALGFLIVIPREINLPFVLKGGATEHVIQFPEKIYLKEKYVSVGDRVSAGTPLVAISSPTIAQIVGDIAQWESQLSFYRSNTINSEKQALDLLSARVAGLDAEINRLVREVTGKARNRQQEMANLRQQIRTEEKMHARNRQLHKAKVISDAEWEQSQQRLGQVQRALLSTDEAYDRELEALRGQLQRTQNEQLLTQKEVDKKKTDVQLTENEIKERLEQAKNRLRLHFGNVIVAGNVIKLLSPVSGSISLVTEEESEVLSEQILVRIRAQSTPYYASAEATPQQIGMLAARNKATLKYQSFPHYYYGTMKAHLHTVSPSPDANGNYPITMRITAFGKIGRRVTKGMTGTASVVIEEKPVFDYLFRMFSEKMTAQ